MIAVVTGHTKGIGKAFAEYFALKGYTVIGFSRSNGFDISDSSIRDKILELSRDADIFVNNAYDFDNQQFNSQNDLLVGMFNQWREQSKVLINVSSISSDYWPTNGRIYSKNKQELDKSMIEFGLKSPKVVLVNLKPSWVDTDRIRNIMPNGIVPMKPKALYKVLDFVLENLNSIKITSITLEPTQ